MPKIVGRVATVPGLRDMKIPFDQCKFINTECLGVIATSFRKLEKLDLSSSKLITDWSLLKSFVFVEALYLSNTNIDDAGLANVERLTSVKLLGLCWNEGITDKGLARLSSLTNLTGLFLGGTKISNAGLKNLKPFVNLKVLSLQETATNDEGLSILATYCPNLTELHLCNTNISDEGVVHLLKFTSLVYLNVHGTLLTEAGRDRLYACIPGLKIKYIFT